jgi:CelD/BcsL family acetyltransferase involved in cellulose biosynthesis
MRATIIRPADLGAGEIAEWHAAMDASALDGPFASPEFAQAVGAVEPRARVAVLSDGPDTVAFLPFMQHR